MVVHAIILAEDGKFRASLGYIDRPCQRKEIGKEGKDGEGKERKEKSRGWEGIKEGLWGEGHS